MAKLADDTTLAMSEVEAAWLAGFLDGEGCIQSYQGGKGGRWLCWKLSVNNTSRPALEKCFTITGVGTIRVKHEASDTRQKQWSWIVNSKRNMASVLRQTLPYLVIKQDAAQNYLDNHAPLE